MNPMRRRTEELRELEAARKQRLAGVKGIFDGIRYREEFSLSQSLGGEIHQGGIALDKAQQGRRTAIKAHPRLKPGAQR